MPNKGVKKAKSGKPSGGVMDVVKSAVAGITKLVKKSSKNSSAASPLTLNKKMSTTSEDLTKAQVDSHVPNAGIYEVYYDKDSLTSYSIYLMKTEIKANNNKFYIVQVLKRKGTDNYFHFTRYGRVG